MRHRVVPCRAVSLLLLALWPGPAPAAVPLPRPRPPELTQPPAAAEPAAENAQAEAPPAPDGTVPLPLPRPTDLTPGGAPPAPSPSPPPAESAGEGDCVDELRKAGATLEPAPPVAEGACGIPHPVHLSRLPGGVELKPAALLNCGMARTLVAFVGQDVASAARERLSAGISAVAVATSYDCRSQNHVAGAKMSDHALGNAVDIAGFTLSGGRSVTIGDPKADAASSAFVADIRKASCARFTTVLGPGSDAEHGNHLHLDLRQRKNGYRICQ